MRIFSILDKEILPLIQVIDHILSASTPLAQGLQGVIYDMPSLFLLCDENLLHFIITFWSLVLVNAFMVCVQRPLSLKSRHCDHHPADGFPGKGKQLNDVF